MDSKDILHIVASLTRMIGEKNMIEGLDNVGWRGIESHPVEFFQGYLGEFDDSSIDGAINMIRDDINRIGNWHGFDLNDDEFVDIVPR